jgi:hypothetical protein
MQRIRIYTNKYKKLKTKKREKLNYQNYIISDNIFTFIRKIFLLLIIFFIVKYFVIGNKKNRKRILEKIIEFEKNLKKYN